MSQDSPDRRTIEAVVALATRAPSIHNTQPWRWAMGDSSVHLFADTTRSVPVTDPDGRDLLVSCGSALHHLRVGFAALGWATVVHRLPNPAEPDHLAAVTFYPRQATIEDIALSAAIPHRRTDRRRFSSWPVPAALLDALAERASHEEVAVLAVRDPRDRFRLSSAITRAAWHQGMDAAYANELAAWTGRGYAAEDGVPAANTPATPVQHGDIPMRTFPDGALDVVQAESEEDAGELLVLATTSDDRVSRLRAGEALSAVLLAATDIRLATCPLSQPVEFGATRDALRDNVLGGVAFPQIVLRIGWAPVGGEPLPATPRRPAAEVLGGYPSVTAAPLGGTR
ncbi:MAG: NAD(P)H nitroreductase [Umezawaea sp.]